MIEQLFGSKTRVKLLQLFMSNPNRSFYVREITRKIDEQINSVRRELANLLSIGIITSDNTNNRLYYEVNQKYEYFEALAAMFGGKKMSSAKKAAKQEASDEPQPEELGIDVADNPLVEQFKKAGHLELLLLTGQFTRDETSGIDVLVVGDMNDTKVEKLMSELEAAENKELRYVVFSTEEFRYRRTIKDRFLSNIFVSKKQVLLDATGLLA